MAGVVAPKDPIAKGSSFYICRDKEIAGNVQPDGSGIQFIYLNDVRLTTFAKMVGNITDETMIENLKTAAGFMRMIAGIGVSVESDDREHDIDFAFQMYGKTDPNHSGTTIQVSCVPDGMEQIIWLDDYKWSDDDDVPGQARFHFQKAGSLATINIKLYLREGFTAPEQEEQSKIDKNSPEYKAMLERSLVQAGNTERLQRCFEKAKRGEDVTIAFIGGSITQGAGAIPIHMKCYAYQTFLKLAESLKCKENIHFVKAGVGGTPSELGMIRFERDVLKDGSVTPDIVVIEYAVNDEGDETKGLCYECLVRKALAVSEDTAVVLLFAVFADDSNLQERLIPIGERYQLPMVSTKNAVTEQFYLKANHGRVLSKSQFFYDSYHPTNVGHMIMSDCLMYLFEQAASGTSASGKAAYSTQQSADWRSVQPVFGTEFEKVKLLDKQSNKEKAEWIEEGSFTETDEALQAVEMDVNFAPTQEFPYNWQHRSGSEPFRMKINCKALLLVSKDSGEITAGKAIVTVDGRQVLTADPRVIGWTHCNAQILISEEESREHLVEIQMAEGDEEKLFTILGIGYVE